MISKPTNKIRSPKPNGLVFSDSYNLLASLYSDGNYHILPKPLPPSAQEINNLSNGLLSLNGTAYKVTYCNINPETGEVILESEPSDPSNTLTVTNGSVTLLLPKPISHRGINGFRIYRLSSFRTTLFPSISSTVQASTDNCTNSTYSVGPITLNLSPTKYLYNNHYFSTISGLSYYQVFDAAANPTLYNELTTTFTDSTSSRLFAQYYLGDIKVGSIGSLTISSVSLGVKISSVTYPAGLTVNVGAYNNDPTSDPTYVLAGGSTPAQGEGTSNALFFAGIAASTGSRTYASASNAFDVPGSATVTLGANSTSQAAVDVANCKSKGSNFAIGFSNPFTNNIAHPIASVKFSTSPTLNVTYSSTPLNFTTIDNRLLMGDRSDIGIRFKNIQIPNSAQIKSAYITFTAWNDNLNSGKGVTVDVYGDVSNSANPATYSTQGDFTGRTLTTNKVTWSPTSWVAGSGYSTPDISTVVQEVVNNASWASGNALAFSIKNNGSSTSALRLAYSFTGSTKFAPVLNIIYTTGQSVGTLYRLLATVSSDGNRIFQDNIPDNILNSSTEIPNSASTDLATSNFQTLKMPGNPLSKESARISLNTVSTYTVPTNKSLVITHMSNGDSFPVSVGVVSPTTMTFWRSEAKSGYMLMPLPLLVPSGYQLGITSGSGTIDLVGYLIQQSSSSDIEPFIWSVGTTPTYINFRGVILGMYQEYDTSSNLNYGNTPYITRDGVNYRPSLEVWSKYTDPNVSPSDGIYALPAITMPIMVKQGDSLAATVSPNAVFWGIKFKGT